MEFPLAWEYWNKNDESKKGRLAFVTEGNRETEKNGTGPYLPLWQMWPTLPLINILNFNNRDLEFFRGSFDQVLQYYGQASFGVMTHLNDPTNQNSEAIKVFNPLLSLGQY
jgi:hypothetical protein